MKYLKTFNENINNDIDAICEKYNIKHYTINDDGTVDVYGDVNLSDERLYDIPLKFRNVNGGFDCCDNKLTSLKGAPQSVGDDFTCSRNKLTSLKGISKQINGNIYCYVNQIKNIDHLPKYYKKLYINNNPIYNILILFLDIDDTDEYKEFYYIKNTKENKELISEFKDREIIQEDILILDRLVEFLEDVGKPKSKKELTKLLKRKYNIR